MESKSDFQVVMTTIRHLMKGTSSLGQFTAELIDMGLKPTGKSALELRKEGSWKGYANGSTLLPARVGSELAKRWDEYRFGENVKGAYEEPALNDLAYQLHALDSSINKGNVAERLGRLFYRIFTKAAGADKKPSFTQQTWEDVADRDNVPYIDREKNLLCLGDEKLGLPPKKAIPDKVQDQELGYVKALLLAYCEEQDRSDTSATVDDIPEQFASHFQDQRKAFYRAEWVRETSWNCVNDGRSLFEEFLDGMYAGITDTNMRQYNSGLERLLATLSQSVTVQFDGHQLDRIIALIDVWSRKGACHELVARKRMRWVN